MQKINKSVRPEGPEDISMDNINYDNEYRFTPAFMSFFCESRFYFEHNLKLAYLLIHVKNCSLLEASTALKVSRTLFYTRILLDNPAFLSRKMSVSGWRRGSHELRIKLSDESIAYTDQIRAFAEYSIESECRRLKTVASAIFSGKIKVEAKYKNRIIMLRKQKYRKEFLKRVAICAKDCGKTKDEVLKDVG